MSELLFFPMSMPDEMLHSRITRYHFLSGNKTARETFRDLFDSEPFGVGMLPKQLQVLAARLPGDATNNLDELIRANTTFPAYRPFLGTSPEGETAVSGFSFLGVARVPRREGTVHGKAKLCPCCVQQDLLELGSAYWHRSHHLPGVSVCWRHGDPLIHSCPKCSHPFFRKLRLLPSVSEACICGWSTLAPSTEIKGTLFEQRFSQFAHEILQQNVPLMSSDALCATYQRQCRKKGYTHGSFTSTAKLFNSIRDKYGDVALSKMDSAYAAGKHDQWIRFSPNFGKLDMPLVRHLIIALHLFGSASEFVQALKNESILKSVAGPSSRQKLEKPQLSKKAQFRQKIELALAIRADANLEYLWKNFYRATRWLKENDNVWLAEKLSADKQDPAEPEEISDPRDSTFADILLTRAENLYKISKEQKRVNITNLQKLLPTRLPSDPSTRIRRFPLASQQLELALESVWHFRLRRLIRALADLTNLNLPVNSGSVDKVASVPRQIFQPIVNLFEWDLDAFAKHGVDPDALLRSTGVPRDWAGPPGFNMVLGGNAYYRNKPADDFVRRGKS
ncbi:TniQ family protein [Pseudomonas typographi]|uniref:TniQ family protein n=1 Tax=Pseudomonas typographi TaxID=2715964 RepID=UPI001682FA06|nr:TniQ family protein [Pseudomonas typographi]MBD1553154.1 TniQ family protein [Pseudomonas typographi]MBD1585858.1 TniQ family protein [Pseudomonas typographi]